MIKVRTNVVNCVGVCVCVDMLSILAIRVVLFPYIVVCVCVCVYVDMFTLIHFFLFKFFFKLQIQD